MSDKTSESVLGDLLHSAMGIGRTGISKEVVLGDFTLTLQPIGSEDECMAFDYAESYMDIPETPNFIDAAGNKTFKPQMGVSYVTRVKQWVIARSILLINDVKMDRTVEIPGLDGDPVPVGDFLLTVVQTWESHVLDYVFIQYNRMVQEIGDKLGFSLPHQVFLAALDQMVAAYIAAQDVSAESDIQEGVDRNLSVDEVLTKEASNAASQREPLLEFRDDSEEGVLERDEYTDIRTELE